MKHKHNAIWLAALLATLPALHADSDSAHWRNLEHRVSALEQRGTGSGLLNPSAIPRIQNGWDVGIMLEPMWARADVDATPKKQFKDAFGGRGKLWMNIPNGDGWELTASYLWLENKLVVPVADKNNKVRMQQFTIDLAREFYVSCWLTLRPMVGIVGIEQKKGNGVSAANAEGLFGGLSPTYGIAARNFENSWRNHGIGPIVGLSTGWGLPMSGLSLQVGVDLAFLKGGLHQDPIDPAHPFLRSGTTQIHWDAALIYDWLMNCDRFMLELGLGVEAWHYPGQCPVAHHSALKFVLGFEF